MLGVDEKTKYSQIPQEKLYDGTDFYIRLEADDENNPVSIILNKIKTNSQKLSEIASVNTGIMGGCDTINQSNLKYLKQVNAGIQMGDGVFVLDKSNPRDHVRIQKFDGTSILKDFYKNSDISTYVTSETSTKAIIFSSDTNNEHDKEIIKDCLNKYKPILEGIRQVNHENLNSWYLLRRGASHPSIFNGPKIVAPQRSTKNTFGYNEVPWYAASDVFFITAPKEGYNLKYILGLLNSKLYYFWLYYKGKRKGNILELIAKPLSEIPIKKCTDSGQETIIDLVDKIIQKAAKQEDFSNIEEKLNEEVYKLYGIDENEQKIIEAIQ